MDDRLPSEPAAKWGHLPFLTKRTPNEWSAACPKCSDAGHVGNDKPDRFRIFAPRNHNENWRGFCRRCRHFEFVDEGKAPEPMTVSQRVTMLREQRKLQQEEEQRLHNKIKSLEEQAYWRGWHDAMSGDHRNLWHQQGIIDYFIEYYNLGYCPDHRYLFRGEEQHSPSLTIPHFDFGFKAVNIQHRLLNPAPGAGKYRQTAGLPAAMFVTNPEAAGLESTVLVVEGAKKAIVVYTHMGESLDGMPISVVGVPSKTPGKRVLGQLADCESIILALDPDAYFGECPAANSMAEELGKDRVRLARFPVKPDDFFVQHNGRRDDFISFLRRAR